MKGYIQDVKGILQYKKNMVEATDLSVKVNYYILWCS